MICNYNRIQNDSDNGNRNVKLKLNDYPMAMSKRKDNFIIMIISCMPI